MACHVVKIENMRTQDAIGTWLKNVRAANKLTLDQIATESRRYGSNWNSGSIKKIESGEYAPSLPNLIILLQSVNRLIDGDYAISDVFHGDGYVDIAEEFSVSRPRVRSILQGESVDIQITDRPPEQQEKIKNDFGLKLFESMAALGEVLPDEYDISRIASFQPTLSEERAAKKLGVHAMAVQAWCDRLYTPDNGKPFRLDDITAMEAGRDATPQKRGRVTREIIDEISSHISERRAHWAKVDEMADRIAANPEQFDVAANDDQNKENEATTPRE